MAESFKINRVTSLPESGTNGDWYVLKKGNRHEIYVVQPDGKLLFNKGITDEQQTKLDGLNSQADITAYTDLKVKQANSSLIPINSGSTVLPQGTGIPSWVVTNGKAELLGGTLGKTFTQTGGAAITVGAGNLRYAFYDKLSDLWVGGQESPLPSVEVDNDYEPNSVNPQSGVAVKQAINDIGLPNFFDEATLINILSNNDFTTLWGGTSYQSLGVLNNVYTWVSTATNGRITGTVPNSATGDKFYIKLSVKTTSNNVAFTLLGTGVFFSTEGTGDWENISGVVTGVSDGQTYVSLTDRRISNWDSIEVKKGVVINLTQTFGAGNEPTSEIFEQMLNTLPDYWFSDSFVIEDKLTTNGQIIMNVDGVMTMVDLPSVVVDNSYSPESSNPQSGVAVKEALEAIELPKFFSNTTVFNILTNNNFETIWGGSSYQSLGISDSVYTWVATAANGRIDGTVSASVIGHKFYVKMSVKTTSNDVRLTLIGTPLSLITKGSGDWENLSGVTTGVVDGQTYVRIMDRRTSNWDPIEVKKGIVVNLTQAFGAGNEPSVEKFEQMLSILPDYWFSDSQPIEDKLSTSGNTILNDSGIIKTVYLPNLQGKKIVLFADSIGEFGNIPEVISKITGATVHDVSIGGTRLIYHDNVPNYDQLSFVKYTEAIMSGDWSAQDTAIQNLVASGDNNTQNYNTLRSIDFNEIDAVLFMYGTNDYRSIGVVIGEDGDDVVRRNIKGSFNFVAQQWGINYPNVKLFNIGSIFRYGNGEDNSDDAPGNSGLYLYNVVEALGHMSKKYHFPHLDLYNSSGINRFTSSRYLSSDGTHPSNEGYELIGEKIARFLLSNF